MRRDTAPRLTTMSLSRFAEFLPVAYAAGFNQCARFNFEIAAPDLFQRARQLTGRNGGEKTESADVDAENWRGRTGDVARGAEHRAVAAENEEQIRLARERRDVAVNDRLASGAFDQLRGLADYFGARGLVGIADQADALYFVSLFFQSAPKIPCCPPGRAAAIPSRRASSTRFARRQMIPIPSAPAHARRNP